MRRSTRWHPARNKAITYLRIVFVFARRQTPHNESERSREKHVCYGSSGKQLCRARRQHQSARQEASMQKTWVTRIFVVAVAFGAAAVTPASAQKTLRVCDKARPGWPCDTKMEKLRDDYARTTTPQDRARLAEAAQVLNTKIVSQIPIGEFWNVTAVGKNVALEPSSMVTVYWGIDKR